VSPASTSDASSLRYRPTVRPLASALCLLSATLACTPTAPPANTGAPVSDPAPSPKSAHEEIDDAVELTPPSSITIVAEAPGRDPSDTESQVTIPLEAALSGMPGLARIESRSSSGSATLTLTLEPGAELQQTRLAVHDRLSDARSSLPDDVSTLLAADLASRSRSTIFSLSPGTDGRASPDILATVLDDLRRVLLQTPGVAAVELCGERPPQVLIAADPQRLKAYTITPLALRQALETASTSGPEPALARGLDAGQSGIDGLLSLVVKTSGEPPSPIYLRDLASVSVALAEPDCDALRVGAGEVIIGVVRPRRGSVEATVRTAVDAVLREQIERLNPRGVHLDLHAPPTVTIHVEVPPSPRGEGSRNVDELRKILPTTLPNGRQALLLAPRDDGPVDAELLLFGAPMSPAELRGIEEQLVRIPGLHVRSIQSLGVVSRQRLRITGDDLETAYELAQEIARLAETIPGVLGARPRTTMTPELIIHERRDAIARLGLTSDQLAQSTRALRDVEIERRLVDGRDLPVLLRIGDRPEGHRHPEAVGAIEIPLPNGGSVRLDAVADIRLRPGPREIHRVDRRRSIDIDLRPADTKLRAALDRVLADKLVLPPGVALVWE